MASGLKSLIKMNKHELDKKQRELAILYDQQDKIKAERLQIETTFEREKKALTISNEIGFTFAGYVEAVKMKLQDNAERDVEIQKRIENAKDSMMETFSELKKYEMTQAERDKKASELAKKKETETLDEVGLQGFLKKIEDARESD